MFLPACKDQDPAAENAARDKAAKTAAAPLPKPESKLDAAATDELVKLRDAYYALKDALVATDAAATDAGASRLLSAAELLRYRLRSAKDPAQNSLVAQLDSVMTGSEQIVALTSDSALVKKRQLFYPLSETMYRLLSDAGLRQATVYRQHCPMAFDNNGGYWLSSSPEIRNPYFGNQMLECGEVTDSL